MRVAYYELAWIAWVIHVSTALISPSLRPRLRKGDLRISLNAQLHNQYAPRHIKFEDNEGAAKNEEKSRREEDQHNDLETAYQDLMSHIKKGEMDIIQQEYLDWCKFYSKEYDESRLPIFVHNYKELEEWIDSGLVTSPHLNEWADRTEDEVREFIFTTAQRVSSSGNTDDDTNTSPSIDADDSVHHQKKQYLPSNEKMASVADSHETQKQKSSRQEGSLLSTPTLTPGPVEKKPNTSVHALSSIRFTGPGQNKRASWRKEPDHPQIGFKTNEPDSETPEMPVYENPSFFEKDEIPSYSRNQQQPSKMASDQARIRKSLDDKKAKLRMETEYIHTPFLLDDTINSGKFVFTRRHPCSNRFANRATATSIPDSKGNDTDGSSSPLEVDEGPKSSCTDVPFFSDHSFDSIDRAKGKSENTVSSIQDEDISAVDSSVAAELEEPLGETIVVGSTITTRRPPLQRQPVDSDSFSISMDRSEQITILRAYQDWCSYYNRAFQPTRISAFAANYESAQQYFKATGMTLRLNEYADMTEKEYMAMMEQEETLCNKLEETQKDSDEERVDYEVEARNFLALEKQRMQDEDERINAAVEEKIRRQAELDRQIKEDALLKQEQERFQLGSETDAEEEDEMKRLFAEHDARLQAEKRLLRGQAADDDLFVGEDDDEIVRIPEKPLWLDAAEADILEDEVNSNVDDEKFTDDGDEKDVLPIRNHAMSDTDRDAEERETRVKSEQRPEQNADKDVIQSAGTNKGSGDDQHRQGLAECKTELKTATQAEREEEKEASEEASLEARIMAKHRGESEKRFMVETQESNLSEGLTIDLESSQEANENGETDEETIEETSLKARIMAKRREEMKERLVVEDKSNLREEMSSRVKPSRSYNGKESAAREIELLHTNGFKLEAAAKVGVAKLKGIDNEQAGARLGTKPSTVSEVEQKELEPRAWAKINTEDNIDLRGELREVDIETVDEAEALGEAETRADDKATTGNEADDKVGHKVINGTVVPAELEALALAVKALELAARKRTNEIMLNEIEQEASSQKTETAVDFEEIRMCEEDSVTYADFDTVGKGTDVVEAVSEQSTRQHLSKFRPPAPTNTQESKPGKKVPEVYPDEDDLLFGVELPYATAGTDAPLCQKVATLSEWKQNIDGTLTGLVKNLSGIKDGTAITTSMVEERARAGSIITTLEGAKYYLQ